MTPEDEARLRELPKLIAEEKDPDRVEILTFFAKQILQIGTARSVGR
jgi:hypothetical protein